jgi:hypothetical protein
VDLRLIATESGSNDLKASTRHHHLMEEAANLLAEHLLQPLKRLNETFDEAGGMLLVDSLIVIRFSAFKRSRNLDI